MMCPLSQVFQGQPGEPGRGRRGGGRLQQLSARPERDPDELRPRGGRDEDLLGGRGHDHDRVRGLNLRRQKPPGGGVQTPAKGPAGRRFNRHLGFRVGFEDKIRSNFSTGEL